MTKQTFRRLLTAGCLLSSVVICAACSANKSNPSTDDAAVSLTDPIIMQTDDGIQTVEIRDGFGEPLISARIQTPDVQKLLSAKAAQAIDEYYVNNYNHEIAEWDGSLADSAQSTKQNTGSAFSPWTIEETYEIPYRSDTLVSIVRTRTITMNAASAGTAVYSETFRADTGTKLSLNTLFITAKREYQDILAADLQKSAENQDTLYSQAAVLAQKNYMQAVWYLNANTLCFAYPAGTLAPVSEGTVTLSIPLAHLQKDLSTTLFSNQVGGN